MVKVGKLIGIVGGVGPFAGLDLNRKIFDHTKAATDQEHLPVLMASFSSIIDDRTRYLLKGDVHNPARGLFQVVARLDSAGAAVAGIPCNTAHARPIFSEVVRMIQESGLRIKLLNMISEVMSVLQSSLAGDSLVGVLSTLGTYKSGLYKTYLKNIDLPVIQPDESMVDRVHAAIYDPVFGIKACANPISENARKIVEDAVKQLGDRGANTVILGCTELPLAVPYDTLQGIKLIDPATVLARALIRETYPEKLKSMTPFISHRLSR